MGSKIHRNSLKAGHKINSYEIMDILGQGGFGITYLANDLYLNRKVAVKEYLPIELAVREGDHSVHPVSEDHGKQYKWGLDRFLSEARTLAQFEHPNIVRVHAVFEENNTGYMVMAYEHGQSLQQKLEGKKTLEEAELLKILIPILGGLELVHKAGFIHRDIKPDNIFIRADGSPVLLDFGSARQAMGEQTKTLTNLVSPGYAPFEQYYSKSDQQGPWTDIYGLGATLYRAIAGVPPMDAADRSNAIIKSKGDTLVPATEIGKGNYNERFLKAIDHALQFKEEDRPQTISAWKAEFDLPEDPTREAVAIEQDITQTWPKVLVREPQMMAESPRNRIPAESLGNQLSRNIKVVIMIAIAVYLLVALYSYHPDDPGWSHAASVDALRNRAGEFGAWIADILLYLFGYPGYFFPIVFAYTGWRLFQARQEQAPFNFLRYCKRNVGLLLIFIGGCGLARLHFIAGLALPYEVHGAGGILGDVIGGAFRPVLDSTGTTLVLLTMFVTGFTLFTGFSWLSFVLWAQKHTVKWLPMISAVIELKSTKPGTKVLEERQQEVWSLGKVIFLGVILAIIFIPMLLVTSVDEKQVMSGTNIPPQQADMPAPPPTEDFSSRIVPIEGNAGNVGITAWVVQLGSFSSEENADALTQKLKKAGFNAFFEPLKQNNDAVYRVRIGPELKRSDADAINERLKKDMQIEGIVVHYP